MAAKLEQTLWESVWEIARPLQRSYGLIGTLSAGVFVLNQMPADIQRDLVASLNMSGAGEQADISEAEWQDRFRRAWADAEQAQEQMQRGRAAKPSKPA